MMNRQIVLSSRPQGKVGVDSFTARETPIAAPGPGHILVRNRFLSLDPYMRGRLNDGPSYAKPQALDEPMIGGTVGEIVDSGDSKFAPGDWVVGMGGWQTHCLGLGREWRKIDTRLAPPSAYLGPLGMPGITAWIGLKTILSPKPGETLVVSAATGAVGSVVGQLAKAAGARVVGIAGGPEKCRYALDELGFDACVDHRAQNFAALMKTELASGVDCLFENVGGEPFAQTIRRLNDFSRIAVCGLIASYEGPLTGLPDLRLLLVKRCRIEGFIVSDHLELWGEALKALAQATAAGRLKHRETVLEGLDAAPGGLVSLLSGGNFGKMIVKLD